MSEAAPAKTGIYLTGFFLLALAIGNGFALYQLGGPVLGANLTAFHEALNDDGFGAALAGAQRTGLLGWLLLPTAGPLVVLVLLLVLAPRNAGAALSDATATAEQAQDAPDLPEPGADGLRLLAALQEEARLVDFIREDLDSYGDEQVGAAARGIHAALRKAVDDRLQVAVILEGEDGDSVEVEAGFDPAQIRITGSPSGEPPYRGVLRHGGWRAHEAQLPRATPGSDPTILAPAEVEVGGE